MGKLDSMILNVYCGLFCIPNDSHDIICILYVFVNSNPTTHRGIILRLYPVLFSSISHSHLNRPTYLGMTSLNSVDATPRFFAPDSVFVEC
jgi:hypothetical protein